MKRFLLFAVLAYAPALLLWGVFALGVGINLIIPGQRSAFAVSALPFLILPWLVIYLIFRRFLATQEDGPRAATLYLGWLGLAALGSYLYLVSIGGASMAAADGAVGRGQINIAALHFIPQTMAFAHVVILPWLFFSKKLLRKYPF